MEFIKVLFLDYDYEHYDVNDRQYITDPTEFPKKPLRLGYEFKEWKLLDSNDPHIKENLTANKYYIAKYEHVGSQYEDLDITYVDHDYIVIADKQRIFFIN